MKVPTDCFAVICHLAAAPAVGRSKTDPTGFRKAPWKVVPVNLILVFLMFTGLLQAGPALAAENFHWDPEAGALYVKGPGGLAFQGFSDTATSILLEWARKKGVQGALEKWEDRLPRRESITSGCDEYRFGMFTVYDCGTPTRAREVFGRFLKAGFSPECFAWRRQFLFECMQARSDDYTPPEIKDRARADFDALVVGADSNYIAQAVARTGRKVSDFPINPWPPAGKPWKTANVPGQGNEHRGSAPDDKGNHPSGGPRADRRSKGLFVKPVTFTGTKSVSTPWGIHSLPYTYGPAKMSWQAGAETARDGSGVYSWGMGHSGRNFTLLMNGGILCSPSLNGMSPWRHSVGDTLLEFMPAQSRNTRIWGLWRVTVPRGRFSDSQPASFELLCGEASGAIMVAPDIVGIGELPEPGAGHGGKPGNADGTGLGDGLDFGPGPETARGVAYRRISSEDSGFSLEVPDGLVLTESQNGPRRVMVFSAPQSAIPELQVEVRITVTKYQNALSPEEIARFYEEVSLPGATAIVSRDDPGPGGDFIRRVYNFKGSNRYVQGMFGSVPGRIFAVTVDYDPAASSVSMETAERVLSTFRTGQ